MKEVSTEDLKMDKVVISDPSPIGQAEPGVVQTPPDEPLVEKKKKEKDLAKENRALKKELKAALEVIDNNKKYILEQEKDIQTFYDRSVIAEDSLRTFVTKTGNLLNHLEDTIGLVRESLQLHLTPKQPINPYPSQTTEGK